MHILVPDLLEHCDRLQNKVIVGCYLSLDSAMPLAERLVKRHLTSLLCAPRNNHICQPLVLVLPVFNNVPARQSCLHGSSLGRTHFGTATSKVSRNSEFSTRSPFLTTSNNDRCERFPLDCQLRFPRKQAIVVSTHVFFLCRLVRPPFARL